MRILCTILMLIAIAGVSFAVNPMWEDPININDGIKPTPPRDIFHCQPPTSGYWTMNASTAFQSELADDVPDEFDGEWVDQIVCYVGEWGDDWMDPAGVIVNLYSGHCPPSMEPYASLYFPWGDPDYMEFEYVNNQPGSYDLEVILFVDPCFQIVAPMSIGFVVDNTWGENAPYCGIDYTEDYDVYGCGEMYIDHENWGYPRWSLGSASHGYPVDVAYCLGGSGVTPTDDSTWSQVKSLY